MKKPRNKILIVDDSKADRELLKEILEQEDSTYEVWTVNSGKLALALIEQDPPDLILLDIHMAETNGFETLNEMKKRGKTIPVLLVSAFTEAEDRSKGIACGAVDFIDKPINAEAVCARVAVQMKMNKLQDRAAGKVGEKDQAARSRHEEFATKSQAARELNAPDSSGTSLNFREFQDLLLVSQESLRQTLSGTSAGLDEELKTRLTVVEKNISRLLEWVRRKE